jgi:hypothetical protein
MVDLLGMAVLAAGAVALVFALLSRAPFARRAGLAVLAVWLCLIGLSLLADGDPGITAAPALMAIFGAIAIAAVAVTGSLGEPLGPRDD